MYIANPDSLMQESSILSTRSTGSTSNSGLSQPEKITLYVVAALAAVAAVAGVIIAVFRVRYQRSLLRSPLLAKQSRVRGIPRSMLDTLPIIQYDDANDTPSSSQRTSSEGFTKSAEAGYEFSQPIATPFDTKPSVTIETCHSTCPICTDDFEKKQYLRVLPCRHQFHKECVDYWLLRVSGTCPVWYVSLQL